MPSFDFRRWREVDLYPLVRPYFFKRDPEQAHELTLALLKKGLFPHFKNDLDPILHTNVCGIDFKNPVGLAAGFDKQAEVIGEVLNLGFGFVEIGSITPEPQPGNPKPRLFRIPEANAVINRYGFNSDGFEVCERRVTAYFDSRNRQAAGVVGINIGKNKNSESMAGDYVAGIRKFSPYGDYLTVNVSSPNTPGLRDLQQRDQLKQLMTEVMEATNAAPRKKPVFLKIAPDQSQPQLEDIAAVALECGVDAIIIGNTTLARSKNIPPAIAKEAGGLSGAPLFDLSTRLLAHVYKLTQGKIPLIGCGGISNGAQAYAKIRAGASLVQLYTALIYKGPWLIPSIQRELCALLRRDGFPSVTQAVGADHKPR